MTAQLAPPRGGAAHPRVAPRSVLAVSAVALAAATAFHAPLLFGGALHHFDWDSHHFHYFDWVRISLTRHHTLPLYMADAWITPNFLANAEAPTLGPLVPLLLLLPTGAYVKLLIVVFAAAGLAGAYLLLRDLDVSGPVAALAATLFAGNGFFASHLGVGHHWAMGAWLLPLLLLLFRRAALGSDGALCAAAVVDAFTILGGQHQPFIWQNLVLGLFAGLWALRVRALFPLARFALLALLAAGLAALKLLPMLAEFGDYDPSARIPGLPAALLPHALLARGQGPSLAFAGLDYEYGSGWWEYAFYVGPLGVACWAVGLAGARGRGVWPLAAVGGLFALLGIEWSGALRWLHAWPLLEHLPLWSSQRCPSRFLVLAAAALCLASAPGLERLWRSGRERAPRAAAAGAGALLALAALDLHVESRAWQRAALGPPLASRPHEPRPLQLRPSEGVRVRLHEFAPNHLVYRASAARATSVTLPLAQPEGGGGWLVGGLPGASRRGRLVVDLPAGEHSIAMTYRPPLLRAGAAVSAASALAVALLAARAARRGARGPAGPDTG